ncbi:endolytic transglycosylase MltG [Demequina activiva]|uniref:Endolytic murein transglycosylase n=1 Tax=Demequina activiva TaxID=1582364 RepID=A0A919Q2F5_9MICO|nr:endolytic transglycosylase MltG [Demequina activiva]GIG54631.1 ABC transporter substrate-binding protein [Demequina activiva]
MTDLFEAEATTTTSLDMRRLQRQQRRATRRKWTLVVSAVAVVLLAIGGSIAWNFVQSFETDSANVAQDYEGAGQGVVQVVVEQGDTGSDIAQTLYEAGVVASPEAFISEARNNPAAAGITPGYYFMQREMKAEFALLALLDPNNRNELTLTIPEGKTLEFYLQAIANLTDATIEEVEAAAADTEALGLPAEADGNLEGWLFPLTYRFNPDAQPADILAEMVDTTVTVLDRNDVPEGDRQEVLTIASLIEREARLDEDRPMISGVIHNRLDIDMALELDSTVKYLNPTEGVFTTAEDRAIDSPYNTYMYPGLPPTPIAAPGEASIIAAMNPADHDYLFFVTVNTDTGETKYAETFEQHGVNVAELREWAQARAAEEEAAEGSDG